MALIQQWPPLPGKPPDDKDWEEEQQPRKAI